MANTIINSSYYIANVVIEHGDFVLQPQFSSWLLTLWQFTRAETMHGIFCQLPNPCGDFFHCYIIYH